MPYGSSSIVPAPGPPTCSTEPKEIDNDAHWAVVDRLTVVQLGELLGDIARHFLLMTATPHSGKQEDFQLFLSLLDKDRFAGKNTASTVT